jgi:hypothetical protein
VVGGVGANDAIGGTTIGGVGTTGANGATAAGGVRATGANGGATVEGARTGGAVVGGIVAGRAGRAGVAAVRSPTRVGDIGSDDMPGPMGNGVASENGDTCTRVGAGRVCCCGGCVNGATCCWCGGLLKLYDGPDGARGVVSRCRVGYIAIEESGGACVCDYEWGMRRASYVVCRSSCRTNPTGGEWPSPTGARVTAGVVVQAPTPLRERTARGSFLWGGQRTWLRRCGVCAHQGLPRARCRRPSFRRILGRSRTSKRNEQR